MLLNFHFLVVLVHRLFSITITYKIPSKVDDNATDVSIVINYNDKEPVETN